MDSIDITTDDGTKKETKKAYKELFQLEVQKMDKGLAVWEGKEAVYNAKGLTFDYLGKEKDDAIASLCPLELDNADKVCKKGFDPKKYNSKFKIRISYNKDSAMYLKDNPSEEMATIEGNEVRKYRQNGDFWLEICTNDPTKEKKPLTCGESSTSYRIQVTRQPNKPPKPIIHVTFKSAITKPMSYRNIYDKVDMDLANTCVSDPDAPDKCLDKWQERYYIKYKWEMKETPTPLEAQSQLQLSEGSGSAGQWLPDIENRDNPKRANFTGLMITPRRYPGETNPTYNAEKCASECGTEPVYDPNNKDDFLFLKISDHLICRQKYCEETKTKYYKINIQAETVDKETDLISDTAEITVIPKIIPQARVVAQLTWKQGSYKTFAESQQQNKEGVAIDIDIHMIKKESLEAPAFGFAQTNGVLGTQSRTEDLDTCLVTDVNCNQYWRHDDCCFSDKGLASNKMSLEDLIRDNRTIAWHASLDIDNTWSGNNYGTPETIGLGPIDDILDNNTKEKTQDSDNDGIPDGDGIPDISVIDDQYLLVVSYTQCLSRFADGQDRCDPSYTGSDAAYEVDVRVEILVDGEEAPRPAGSDRPADTYTKDFKMKVHEWQAIAVVKWDNKLESPKSNPTYPGNAIVTNTKENYEGIEIDPVNYPVCNYEMSEAILAPIWDEDDYLKFITCPDATGAIRGKCNKEFECPASAGN